MADISPISPDSHGPSGEKEDEIVSSNSPPGYDEKNETHEHQPTISDPRHRHDDIAILNTDYEDRPTEEELATLRRIPGEIPWIAFLLCAVEFCERASYYGCANIWTNYINRPLPPGGNGYGAVAPNSPATAGALGMGTKVANAVSQSFKMLSYCLPMFFGYLADAKTGRFFQIFWGVIVCGVGHVLIVAGGAKALIDNGTAKIPFFLGVYILAIGAAMFKPNVTPLLLDQMRTHVPRVKTLPDGERVIVDPEHSAERVMLWFYLLINIGAFMSTATSYSAKYVGWWLAFLLPLILYLPLPFLLLWLKPRLRMHEPGGSDLPNACRVLARCLAGGGLFRIGRKGWWERAKPSYQAAHGMVVETRWNDQFVDDVKRALQATGMFCFFPVQYWNDNGIGNSANYQGTILDATGVTNDVLGNFNSLAIILFNPLLNFGLYPFLRRAKIHYGPVARITTAFALSTLSGVGYTVLQYYAYKEGPCGYYSATDPECVDNGLVAPITVWWQAIPYSIGGISELFMNVPAYGLAYSRAPVNMRGLVSALNLLNTGFAFLINLVLSDVITDPNLIWDFGGPAIVGAVVTVFFYWNFRHIDKEEYVLSTNQVDESTGARPAFAEGSNDRNASVNEPVADIERNEKTPISQKM